MASREELSALADAWDAGWDARQKAVLAYMGGAYHDPSYQPPENPHRLALLKVAAVVVSPGGVGFIRATAVKDIPGAPPELATAKRKDWLSEGDDG